MNQLTDLQFESTNVIIKSMKDFLKEKDIQIFFSTLFHKDNGNVIFRPYQPKELSSFTFIVDAMGNREKIDESTYQKLLDSYQ